MWAVFSRSVERGEPSNSLKTDNAQMKPTPLNVFQRIMRLWDQVHPYNAAQVIQLAGVHDVQRLGAAWFGALNALGLGEIHVSGNQFYHAICSRQATKWPVQVVQPGTGLDEFISQEMNQPFVSNPGDPAPYCPFRPFLLEEGGASYIGVVYQHWVADSFSIRLLLREWFYRYFDPPRARSNSLVFARGGLWHFFGPNRGGWDLDEGILTALRLTTRFCNVRRIEQDGVTGRVRCSVLHLPEGIVDHLLAVAHGAGVTLHDLFLAVAAETCHRCHTRPLAPERRELALGTIVDLRGFSRNDLGDIFGLFMGFTTVQVRPKVLGDWPALLRSIALQSVFQKQHRLAQISQIRMAAAIAESRFLSLPNWVKFYQKHMPLAAGISNVNMRRTWAAEYHPQLIMDYLRFSPTGPTIPLLFTTSSLGCKFHLALTWREGLIDSEQADRITTVFARRLEQIATAAVQQAAE